LTKLEGPICLRPGEESEAYTGIGTGNIRLEGIPVFADDAGPFGSTTRDSERAIIRVESTKVAIAVVAASGGDKLQDQLEWVVRLLQRHASAFDLVLDVIRPRG
jgi:DNA/RNA-binding domain of Phe-tRNA-synthetase-like protein